MRARSNTSPQDSRFSSSHLSPCTPGCNGRSQNATSSDFFEHCELCQGRAPRPKEFFLVGAMSSSCHDPPKQPNSPDRGCHQQVLPPKPFPYFTHLQMRQESTGERSSVQTGVLAIGGSFTPTVFMIIRTLQGHMTNEESHTIANPWRGAFLCDHTNQPDNLCTPQNAE